jgi:hypothetical protein
LTGILQDHYLSSLGGLNNMKKLMLTLAIVATVCVSSSMVWAQTENCTPLVSQMCEFANTAKCGLLFQAADQGLQDGCFPGDILVDHGDLPCERLQEIADGLVACCQKSNHNARGCDLQMPPNCGAEADPPAQTVALVDSLLKDKVNFFDICRMANVSPIWLNKYINRSKEASKETK